MASVLMGQIEAIVLRPPRRKRTASFLVKVAHGLKLKVINDPLQHYKLVVGMSVVLAFKNVLHDIIAKLARHKLCKCIWIQHKTDEVTIWSFQ